MNKDAIRKHVACNYPLQYRLVVEGGKLVDGWSNVADHCFTQVAVTEILCEIVEVTPAGPYRLAKVAACHDWNKRLEKKPGDFTEEERVAASEMLEMADVDESLLRATGPSFLLRVKDHHDEIDVLEFFQFFIDDMVHDKVMLLDDRINEAEKRNPQPGGPELEAQLGRRYWDAERETGHEVETFVLLLIQMSGQADISSAQELVDYLNIELDRRFPD